ncbi:unnamed protein product [Rotaria sp. Silwood1]|nr:unnamed protein product [Rotaria sp. Silwood1]CAF1287636.1 unnamed protein product [Rotaria sp. Silwood1]CAF1292087.1 unnamed protein product [Rotaria sp. Silwood1]CAF3464824.1 unnamed protein product [Rotaria sp. Silwood1]CAF3512444.1 unnamed protein product [Rotaria sp. Silwood1]
MNAFEIMIFYIFIASINVDIDATGENSTASISTTTDEYKNEINSEVTWNNISVVSDATIIDSITTKTTDNNTNSSSVTDPIPPSSSMRTLLIGESAPTRSAQLGMGLGIAFFGIILIGEIVFFKYFYHGQPDGII